MTGEAQPRPFFVPGSTKEEAEATYEALAAFAGRSVPAGDERVYRIEWIDDGERWTAEVGKQIHGDRVVENLAKRRQKVAPTVTFRVAHAVTVRAIFPGTPWLVVTDAGPLGSVNPFVAGKPEHVEYFAPTFG